MWATVCLIDGAFTWWKSKAHSGLLIWALSLVHEGSTFQRPHLLKLSHWRLEFQPMNLGDTFIPQASPSRKHYLHPSPEHSSLGWVPDSFTKTWLFLLSSTSPLETGIGKVFFRSRNKSHLTYLNSETTTDSPESMAHLRRQQYSGKLE